MKSAQLIAAGEAAFGPRWQADMAKALNVDERTVRSWISGRRPIPSTRHDEIIQVLSRRKRLIEKTITTLEKGETMKLKKYEVAIIAKGDEPDEPTTGSIQTTEDLEEGDVVTVSLHDENGTPVEATGKITEILSVDELGDI